MFFFFFSLWTFSAAIQAQDIADELNRRDGAGHYLFEGTWRLKEPIKGIETVKITPRSFKDGDTWAQIEISGPLLQKSPALSLWSSTKLNEDRLSTRRISHTANTTLSHRHVVKKLWVNFRTGESTPLRRSATSFHSCELGSISISVNPRIPNQLEFSISYFLDAPTVRWPEVDIDFWKSQENYKYVGGSPECLYNGKEKFLARKFEASGRLEPHP